MPFFTLAALLILVGQNNMMLFPCLELTIGCGVESTLGLEWGLGSSGGSGSAMN